MVSFHTRRRGESLAEYQIQWNLAKNMQITGNGIISLANTWTCDPPPLVNGTDIGTINVIFN
jgi:hypothetical protein